MSTHRCAGDFSELKAIAATVSGKENVAGDAAVIQARACELELLVPQIMARQAARADTILESQSAFLTEFLSWLLTTRARQALQY